MLWRHQANLGAVSDIVTDGLTAFGLKAKDSGHFADVLAQTSSKANTDVRGSEKLLNMLLL